MLVLQAPYNLSDDACEFQICDGLPFMRFLGLGPWPRRPVPDAKGALAVRRAAPPGKAIEKLFVRTIDIARAEVTISMVNLAYNFKRLAGHEALVAPV